MKTYNKHPINNINHVIREETLKERSLLILAYKLSHLKGDEHYEQ